MEGYDEVIILIGNRSSVRLVKPHIERMAPSRGGILNSSLYSSSLNFLSIFVWILSWLVGGSETLSRSAEGNSSRVLQM